MFQRLLEKLALIHVFKALALYTCGRTARPRPWWEVHSRKTPLRFDSLSFSFPSSSLLWYLFHRRVLRAIF